MDSINAKFAAFKRLTLGPLYSFFKSDRGNSCMRQSGRYIVIAFYLYQLLHLGFYIFHHIPILMEQYETNFG